MPKLTITRFRALIRSLNYVVSIHAAEGLDDLTGQIIERQCDRQTREVKCVIRGFTLDGLEAETIVKLGPTGRLVVITAYLA